ncbi:hypothetical protein AMELA_G00174360 [Ameiurus melas]|uniref:SAND domain-containing protein n=1 Tax=Ameiurus melas TaxID=219545 RepID=A0A7J6ACN7_AMEME|nr:hypothetical protein AMELA_G00174360 [Ameiurus melas]
MFFQPACRKKLIRCRSGTSRGNNSHTSKSDSTSDSSSESDDDDDDDDDDDCDDVRDTESTFSANSYKVKCSSGRGVLHVNRFAHETCGKCIRTQDAWLTPRDFLNLYKADGNWRRDIICQGVSLGKLIMVRIDLEFTKTPEFKTSNLNV